MSSSNALIKDGISIPSSAKDLNSVVMNNTVISTNFLIVFIFDFVKDKEIVKFAVCIYSILYSGLGLCSQSTVSSGD